MASWAFKAGPDLPASRGSLVLTSRSPVASWAFKAGPVTELQAFKAGPDLPASRTFAAVANPAARGNPNKSWSPPAGLFRIMSRRRPFPPLPLATVHQLAYAPYTNLQFLAVFLHFRVRYGGEPCCAVKLFFRAGPEKPISPLRTSFVTPRPAARPSRLLGPLVLTETKRCSLQGAFFCLQLAVGVMIGVTPTAHVLCKVLRIR